MWSMSGRLTTYNHKSDLKESPNEATEKIPLLSTLIRSPQVAESKFWKYVVASMEFRSGSVKKSDHFRDIRKTGRNE